MTGIKIRLAEKKDSIAICEIYKPYVENSAISFELKAPDSREIWRRMQEVLDSLPWLVAEMNDRVVGYSYTSNHRSRGGYSTAKEISAYVAKDFQHLGIGTALYYANIEILRLLGCMTILAGITLPNPASVRFHEKMGFRKIGTYHNIGYKMGRYRDTCWYELIIGNQSQKGVVLELHALLQREEYVKILEKAVNFIHLPDR